MRSFYPLIIRLISFSVLVLCFSVPVVAQYRFDRWENAKGALQQGVNDILHARDGYIWGVTFGGIFCFDGVRFKVFDKSNTEGLDVSRFTGLKDDEDGRLWFFSGFEFDC